MARCKLNIHDTVNRAVNRLKQFQYPDSFHTATPVGRRAVSNWVVDVVNSDAPLMQMRQDLSKAGIQVSDETNFTDAYGNLGNSIAAAQQHADAKVIEPMLTAIRDALDTHGITDKASRDEVMSKVAKYREYLHAIERHKEFVNLKTPFSTALSGQEMAEATRERRKANEDFLSGKITPEQFKTKLAELAAKYKLSREQKTISGMDVDAARAALEAIRTTSPEVDSIYQMVKPSIDDVFARIIDLNRQAGKLSDESSAYLALYDFKHYCPTFSTASVDSLNEASSDNISADVLSIAEGGLVTDRIPLFPAMHLQLNGAAKALVENRAAKRLKTFAEKYGKDYGIKVGDSHNIYSVTEIGHSMARMKYPEFSVPHLENGEVTWITIDTHRNAPNRQLFTAIKNRLTQSFNTSISPVDRTIQRVMTHAPARLFTNLNPSFWLNSAIRDPLHALLNVSLDSRIKNKREVASRVLELMTGEFNHAQAMKYYALHDPVARLAETSEFANWATQLADLGGETIFNRAFYSQDYVGENATTEMPYDLGGKVQSIDSAASAATDAGSLLLKKTGDMVTAFDMQARTAVFRALVEQGTSPLEAASIVREFMDFSAKGLTHNTMLTLIPFFRTTVVASHRTLTSLLYDENGDFAPKYQQIAGMIAIGFLWAAAASGDDDEDGISAGDKISNSKLFSNVVVGYDSDGNARSLPLPYGAASIFVGLGSALHRMQRSAHNPVDVLESYSLHVARNLLPLPVQESTAPSSDTGDDIVAALANLNPVIGQAASLYAGKDAFGRDLYADNTYSEGTVQALQGKVSTPETYKDMAIWLYDNLGADVYPETIAELLKNWTPLGSGRLLDRELKSGMQIVQDDASATDPSILSSMVNGIYLDKSPSMWAYTQYTKAVAIANDIKRRLADSELASTVSPTALNYLNALAPYLSQINSINAQMKNAPEEQKAELRREKQRLAELAGRVSIKINQ